MGTYDTIGGTPRSPDENELPCEICGKFADNCSCTPVPSKQPSSEAEGRQPSAAADKIQSDRNHLWNTGTKGSMALRVDDLLERAIAHCRTLEAQLAARDEQLAKLREALKKLSFAAQITGGTAGRDENLCEAIALAEAALTDTQPTSREGM